jgi:hypothetical protein
MFKVLLLGHFRNDAVRILQSHQLFESQKLLPQT